MTVITPDITQTLETVRTRVQIAGTNGMRSAMEVAERVAKASHKQLSGWENDTGNLEKTITGYVAGDSAEIMYAHAKEVNTRPNNSKRALSGYYEPDFDVSPPVDVVPGHIIGVLHTYMTYSNRLPWATKKPDINVTALEALGPEILDIVQMFMLREL